MTDDSTANSRLDRYKPLGLVANPFSAKADDPVQVAIELDVASEGRRLLAAIVSAAGQEKARPIVVTKYPIPSYYPLRAIAGVEYEIANDDSVGVLHAYVQMYMMHIGRIRSTLGILGERLAFRSFDKTLAIYLGTIVDEPDTDLISFQVLGEEAWAAFVSRYREDPAAAVEYVFGELEVERRPELAIVSDIRLTRLEVDASEEEETPEVDSTIGEPPGADVVLAEEADGHEQQDESLAVLDYIVEYTKEHLSPVIARGLRRYRERGLAAMSDEFRITKAPRKTLAALVKLARMRFRKVALIYDGFDSWAGVPNELRSQIAGSLSEMRWMLESDAVMVLLLEQDTVPELDEQFGAGVRVDWRFDNISRIFDLKDEIDPNIVNTWLETAAAPGREPLTLANEVLSAIVDAAEGSLMRFATMAAAAIDDAADRGIASLDQAALEAGLAAKQTEAQSL